MIATLSLAAALAIQQDPGAGIVSDAIARYYTRTSAHGTIMLTASVGKTKAQIETKLSFVEPNLFAVEQRAVGENAPPIIAISDGTSFVYPEPMAAQEEGAKYVRESVQTRTGPMTIHDMYLITSKFLVDRSSAMDIIFGRRVDLEFVTKLYRKFKSAGTAVIDGETVRVVNCEARRDPSSEFKGLAAFYVNSTNDLRRIVYVERIGERGNSLDATYTWDINVEMNAPDKIPAGTFSLKRIPK